jgi:eukaryotic-like serine/threonine-protein kinase
MQAERWQQIEDLCQAVLSQAPEKRAAFLAQACPDDLQLRSEVQSLLDQKADSFLEGAPLSPIQALSAGAKLGNFEIVELLGQGGMGVVYRARDTKLGREVAIKVLLDTLAQDPDRLARFNREAKLLASLNHPNIGHIYGVESQALVMELVEGETIGSLIKSGPLPIRTALKYARQISEALEAAHKKGIIHRDLKPANIMVTPAGLVKVLDFGLAKAEEAVAASDPAESPTAMLSSTRSGVILGTAAYMSPEQARGDTVDKRTDIWAFGVVLYEMLTGRRAFSGETVTDILAGIFRGEPDWGALPRSTPLGIRKLLRRCLVRDRKPRLQAIGEARIEIEAALAEESASDSSIIAGVLKRHQQAAVGSVAGVAALVALTWLLLDRPANPPAELTQKQLTFNSSENPVQSTAISPDGKYLAYSDPAGIHVKLLSTGEERLIPRSAGGPPDAYWYVDAWFPDGTQLLAHTEIPGGHKNIWTVSVVGQAPRLLREDAVGFGVSPDGTHIAFGRSGNPDSVHEISVMGIHGDNPHTILTVGENEFLQSVHWSPDGQRLAYAKNQSTSHRQLPQTSIETCDLKGANRIVVVAAERNVWLEDFCWLAEGRMVYARLDAAESRDSNLWQIGIENHAGRPTGKPKRIHQWPRSNLVPIGASADGKRLVLLRTTFLAQAYVGELAAGGTRLKPPRQLTKDEADDSPTAWTANSKAVLFQSDRNGRMGIFKQGINQETAEVLFTGPQNPDVPRVSSDGAWVLFASAAYRMMRIPASGGSPQFVMETRDWLDYGCARTPATLCTILERTRDQKQVLITAFDPLKGRGKVIRTIEGINLLDYSYVSALSPDGRTLAIAQVGGEIHVRLISLQGGSDRDITVKGWPTITGVDWATDGKGLYCGSLAPQGSSLLYVDLSGNARMLLQFKGGGGEIWGVPSPDGRYIAIKVPGTNSNVWMLEGF